jgi:hypothetical protein
MRRAVNKAPDRRQPPLRTNLAGGTVGRQAHGHRDAILARDAEGARRAQAEHPGGTATRLRGFLP